MLACEAVHFDFAVLKLLLNNNSCFSEVLNTSIVAVQQNIYEDVAVYWSLLELLKEDEQDEENVENGWRVFSFRSFFFVCLFCLGSKS